MDNLPTLQETMLSILKDHTRQLMDYQRLIARFPIPDSSVEALLMQCVQYQRDLKAGNANLKAFKPLIESSYDVRAMVGDLLLERYSSNFVEMFGAGVVFLMRSGANDWADTMNAPEIRLVS